jgi:hypothetical protein
MRVASDLTTLVKAAKGIAVAKAKQGDYQHALNDLERISPLIHHASLEVYHDCLNSLAVELGAIGRKQEARNIIRHVLASPYALSYPEWQQTGEDLKPSSRSFAVLRPTRIRKAKLLHMPPREHGESTWSDTAAPIVSLEEWRQQINDKTNIDNMTESQILMETINRVSARELTYEQRRRILESVRKIMAEPPKDEDEE